MTTTSLDIYPGVSLVKWSCNVSRRYRHNILKGPDMLSNERTSITFLIEFLIQKLSE